MPPKKKPVVRKQKRYSETSVSETTHRTVAHPKAADKPDDDDSDQELERNFALINRANLERIKNQTGELVAENAGQRFSDSESSEQSEDTADEDEVDSDATGSESDSEDTDDMKNSSAEMKTEEDVKRELSTMSFEEIMKLQNKVGTKVYNRVAYGSTDNKEPEKSMRRLNKNRPMEISSKKPVPFLRHVLPVKKKLLRDPRFDDLSGEYKGQIFQETYRFIDDIKRKEKELVQKKLKKVRSVSRRQELDLLLKRMVNQENAEKQKRLQRDKELEFKRSQRARAKEGHRPFFLKKSDKRKLELAEKYKDLKKSGKLENFLNKKRKRNAMKDRRKLPAHQKAH